MLCAVTQEGNRKVYLSLPEFLGNLYFGSAAGIDVGFEFTLPSRSSRFRNPHNEK